MRSLSSNDAMHGGFRETKLSGNDAHAVLDHAVMSLPQKKSDKTAFFTIAADLIHY